MREATDERGAVKRLELMELAAVHDARDHLAHIIGRANILGDDAIEIARIKFGRLHIAQIDVRLQVRLKRRDDIPHDAERMIVILRDMIDHAGLAAM